MIKAVIFDLGNVLLYFDHQIIYQRLEQYLESPSTLQLKQDTVREQIQLFERGRINADEFYDSLTRILDFQGLTQKQFERIWTEIFWLNDELLSLLPSLRKQVSLHMLSNTNALHFEFARRAFPEVFRWFSTITLSYEVETSKPDIRIFQHVVNEAKVTPAECLYFDDINRHIVGATELGICAYQYHSVQSVNDICRLYDIIV